MKNKRHILHIPSRITRYAWKKKALLTIIVFSIYLCFFDKFNLATQYKIYTSLSDLKTQKENYVQLIAEAKQDKKDLEQNYEKFAREKYHMARQDEDIFIIETKKKTDK
ncbi:MAG: septum formation initiator family protein [Saprospiraceae bacterium]|nr:septum formation initiator family protein [Candidatus Vicinibacter affinis]MBP6172156.1 hypothetical protein [Saprospiraceae bacterium]MBK6571218.1 septum formation initiator family protein [Candidatus Vicinibacter affinis]MBK6822854.1 septum formation initiator family protein [Candidatus Vicinibacter affinis]MBK7304952.1 septum formation initiator family protein [Candidatus Vicinibacter affinis]